MDSVPTLAAALTNVNVLSVLSTAWQRSQQDQYEYGGWIYWDKSRGIYTVKTITNKSSCSIILTNTKDLEALQAVGTILADFHCHPFTGNYAKAISAGQPSQADITNAAPLSYGRLVFTPKTGRDYKNGFTPKALPTGFKMIADEQAVVWVLKGDIGY